MNPFIPVYIALSTLVAPLASAKSLDKYHEEIAEMSLDENLQTPEVPKKLIEPAKAQMKNLAEQLAKAGLDANATERNGLVADVVISAAKLFAPNDTLVMPHGVKDLYIIASQMRIPDRYKLIVAVHSDDTGSEEYLNSLTRRRANAIIEWLEKNGVSTDGVVGYGMGFDEPVDVAPSRKARAANRRVEFYFVPGPTLIESLKAAKN